MHENFWMVMKAFYIREAQDIIGEVVCEKVTEKTQVK